MGLLRNKVANITSGNSGIGKAAAKLFVENGARVVITARRQDVLDNTVSEIGGTSLAFAAMYPIWPIINVLRRRSLAVLVGSTSILPMLASSI